MGNRAHIRGIRDPRTRDVDRVSVFCSAFRVQTDGGITRFGGSPMKTKIPIPCFYALVLAVVFGMPSVLLATDMGTKVEKIRIIEPGEAERCANDFFIDNIGKEEADLRVVLGHKVYVNEIMQPGEKRAFDLPATINVARLRGREDVSFDEIAVIINLGPKSHLRVRCMDLKENPLKGKDPLTVFK